MTVNVGMPSSGVLFVHLQTLTFWVAQHMGEMLTDALQMCCRWMCLGQHMKQCIQTMELWGRLQKAIMPSIHSTLIVM
jgi:hypothetical protein